MYFRRSVQGWIPTVVSRVSSTAYREFTEEQMRAYFTKDDTRKIHVMTIAFIGCIASVLIGIFWLVYIWWFILAGLLFFLIGGIFWLVIRLSIQVPSDEQYDAWVDKKAKEKLGEALLEEGQEDLTSEEQKRLLSVCGYVLPGTKEAKQHMKQDVLWKRGGDGVMRYSVNIRTYVLPLEHRIVLMRLIINTVNHLDSGGSNNTYFYHAVGAIQKVDENEIVEIEGIEYMYRTRSFCLDVNGRTVSVTIRSLPITRDPDLPKFDFIQPDVEETIRKLSNFIRSIKERGA